jgi:hypothetical protein
LEQALKTFLSRTISVSKRNHQSNEMEKIISTMLRMLQTGLLVSLLAVPQFSQTARLTSRARPARR